jgi:hypothetical protein
MKYGTDPPVQNAGSNMRYNVPGGGLGESQQYGKARHLLSWRAVSLDESVEEKNKMNCRTVFVTFCMFHILTFLLLSKPN